MPFGSGWIRHRLGAASCALLVSLTVFGSGCGTAPPVQEMSDARQAISIAKEAGAEQIAAADLRAAEEFLDSAERKLTERAYAQARSDALQAKAKALDALAAAQGAADNPDNPP